MRLIDADKFVFEINIEISRRKEDDLTSRVLKAMITDIDNRPTVDAVPLDKLCELLADMGNGKNNTLCIECCGLEGAECPDKNCLCQNPDAWKRHLIKLMEGLDGTD